MVYRDSKYLTRRAVCDKILRDKEFNITKNLKYNGNQSALASRIYTFCDKKGSGRAVKTEIIQNEELAGELQKPIIRKFDKKGRVQSSFTDNIWCSYLVVKQLISTFDKGFRFSLCFIDIYSKSVWFIPLKDKKALQLLMLSKKS